MLHIVRLIQMADTWSDVKRDRDGQFGVTVIFDTEEDAELFKVELMMVASGQHGYEKDNRIPQ